MAKEMDSIDIYIQKVDNWLPYPMNLKNKVLENLRSDVLEVIQDTGETNPELAFGDPYHVAKSISKGQDWGTIRADFGTRFWAYLFDELIIVIAVVIGSILWVYGAFIPFQNSGINLSVIFFSIFFLLVPYTIIWIYGYFVVFEKLFGTTPGKRLFGLSVCDESGIRITWFQALVRNFTKIESVLLLLELLIAHYRDTNYQRLLDLVAQTIVVRKIN
jgi:uncharacterized RDD family membrane protein YckC